MEHPIRALSAIICLTVSAPAYAEASSMARVATSVDFRTYQNNQWIDGNISLALLNPAEPFEPLKGIIHNSPEDNVLFLSDPKYSIHLSEGKEVSLSIENGMNIARSHTDTTSIHKGWTSIDIKFSITNNGEDLIFLKTAITGGPGGIYRYASAIHPRDYARGNIEIYLTEINADGTAKNPKSPVDYQILLPFEAPYDSMTGLDWTDLPIQLGLHPQQTRWFGFMSKVTVHSYHTTSVPEPATWLSMIAGFAVAGVALRRRDRPARLCRKPSV